MKKVMPLRERVWQGRQSWNFEALYRLFFTGTNHHKLRIEIHKDAYDFQSWGRISRWDGTQWQRVATIPGQQLKTRVSYVANGVRPQDFSADEKDLLAEAEMVLGD